MTLYVANKILLERSLTFLGLSGDPLILRWGGMLPDGRTYLQTARWAIMLTVLGLNLMDNWLLERLDPTEKI